MPPQLEAIILDVENKDKQKGKKETYFYLFMYGISADACNNRRYDSVNFIVFLKTGVKKLF